MNLLKYVTLRKKIQLYAHISNLERMQNLILYLFNKIYKLNLKLLLIEPHRLTYSLPNIDNEHNIKYF